MNIKFYFRQSQSVENKYAQKNVHDAHFSVHIFRVILHECTSSIKRINCFIIYIHNIHINVTSL